MIAVVLHLCSSCEHNAVADSYHQTLQKKGQPLHEGFTIVKVRAARVADPAWWLLALFRGGLPYLATRPTACPWTRTSEMLALFGNLPYMATG